MTPPLPPLEPTVASPPGTRPRRLAWRKRLRGLHRDIGFFVFGLTLVYAISGIAVNHRHDWNANEATQRTTQAIGRPSELLRDLVPARRAALAAAPAQLTDAEVRALIPALGASFGLTEAPRNAFFRGPDRLLLFYGASDTDVIEYTPSTGTAERVVRRDRLILRDLNALHLNEPLGVWTWVADTYAALLAFLALSGVVMLRGKRGLAGRGALYLGLGLLVPLVASIVARHL